MSRPYRNYIIFVVSILIVSLVYTFNPTKSSLGGFSISTAYVSLTFLSLALLIGPFNLIRRHRNPVSSYFRRDIGIWSGIFGLVHTVLGLQVHFKGNMALYFIFPPEKWQWMPLRYDFFGMANYAGLVATVLFCFLLWLSRNSKLKKLGVERWKKYQRLTYVAALAVLFHAVIYQVLDKQWLAYVGVLLMLVIVPVVFQWRGYLICSRK